MLTDTASRRSALVGILAVASATGWVLLPADAHAMHLTSLCSTVGTGLLRDWKLLTLELGMLSAKDAVVWFAMLLAMAPPLVLGPLIRLKAPFSPVAGWLVVGIFLLGYACAWSLMVPALIVLATELNLLAQAWSVSSLLLGCAVAFAWQVTPLKRRALELCHQPRAIGRGDPHDARRTASYGFVNGVGCAGSCWALMLIPMTAAGDGRLLMALVTLAALVERRSSARRMAGICLAPREADTMHPPSLQQR